MNPTIEAHRPRPQLRQVPRPRRHGPHRTPRRHRAARPQRRRQDHAAARAGHGVAPSTPARCGSSARTRATPPDGCGSAARSATSRRRPASTPGSPRSRRSTTSPCSRSTRTPGPARRGPPGARPGRARPTSPPRRCGRSRAACSAGSGWPRPCSATPELLVLDEPTVGLDPEQRIRFRDLVSEAGHGRTVVLSTHQTEDVAAVCSHVVVVNQRPGPVRRHGRGAHRRPPTGRVWVDDQPRPPRVRRVAAGGRQLPPRRRPAGRGRAGRSADRGRLPADARPRRRAGGRRHERGRRCPAGARPGPSSAGWPRAEAAAAAAAPGDARRVRALGRGHRRRVPPRRHHGRAGLRDGRPPRSASSPASRPLLAAHMVATRDRAGRDPRPARHHPGPRRGAGPGAAAWRRSLPPRLALAAQRRPVRHAAAPTTSSPRRRRSGTSCQAPLDRPRRLPARHDGRRLGARAGRTRSSHDGRAWSPCHVAVAERDPAAALRPGRLLGRLGHLRRQRLGRAGTRGRPPGTSPTWRASAAWPPPAPWSGSPSVAVPSWPSGWPRSPSTVAGVAPAAMTTALTSPRRWSGASAARPCSSPLGVAVALVLATAPWQDRATRSPSLHGVGVLVACCWSATHRRPGGRGRGRHAVPGAPDPDGLPAWSPAPWRSRCRCCLVGLRRGRDPLRCRPRWSPWAPRRPATACWRCAVGAALRAWAGCPHPAYPAAIAAARRRAGDLDCCPGAGRWSTPSRGGRPRGSPPPLAGGRPAGRRRPHRGAARPGSTGDPVRGRGRGR